MPEPTVRESDAERSCIVTRRREPPEAMIRFVRAPDGAVTPDIRGRLPGRGVWVTARRALVAEATKKRLFGRGMKAQVDTPPQLAEDVDRLLEADCLQMLALANKAGAVVAGFGKASDAVDKGGVAALIAASDGGEDGKRKLAGGARRRGPAPPVVGLFASAQLDLALGRTNVIHAALATSGPAAGFLTRCRRLAAYRDLTLDGAPAERNDTPAVEAAGADDDVNGLGHSGPCQDRELDERERE